MIMHSFAVKVLEGLAFLYDILTCPVYFFLQAPWKKLEAAARVRALPTTRSQDVTYRNVTPLCSLLQTLKNDGVDTMTKVVQYAVNTYEDASCLGTRQILSEEEELQPNGKVFLKWVMGEYEFLTYREVDEKTDQLGRGLREMDLSAKGKVIIFSETRAEWLLSAIACFKQNFTVVTLYATLGEEALVHGITETEARHIITSHDQLPKLKSVLERTPNIQHVVYMESQLKKTSTQGYKDNVKFYSFTSVLEMGSRSDKVGVAPDREDTAIIMYTSGSTGIPKGVVVTHHNMVSALFSIGSSLIPILSSEERYLGFLPLAHILELLGETVCLLGRCSIGYSSPFTMTGKSTKIKRGSHGDANVFKPTIVTSVPLILDRIAKNVWDNVSKGGEFNKAIFEFSCKYKRKWLKRGFDTPVLNKLVFGRVKAILGGHVKMIMSGGAPLSSETHDFIRSSFCCPVMQGYGLTETCACTSLMDVDDLTTGRAGPPLSCCDVRLVNWEEGGYLITDKPNPRGEVIVGGLHIAKGYYKLPDKTAEDFYEEDGTRWFRTGDIGEMDMDGVLKIIDRKKDLVKLQFGEYVSLGKVESVLKTMSLVDNICVFGDSSRDYVVSLVVPVPGALKEFAGKLGKSNTSDLKELCEDKDVRAAFFKEMQAHGKKSGLEKFEIPAVATLCHEMWTPDLDLVTAAFKLKRRNIQKKYQADIDFMYR